MNSHVAIRLRREAGAIRALGQRVPYRKAKRAYLQKETGGAPAPARRPCRHVMCPRWKKGRLTPKPCTLKKGCPA